MNTEEFDDLVRKKIDQPTLADDPRAWDLFMLSAIDRGEESLFEDTSTDQLIKNSLGNYKAEYNQESWDSLSKKLDLVETAGEPLIAQAKFDKVVSNSLKGITRKYDAATWPKLAARIEAEEKYLRHYYRAKAIEALLFCLLILTFYQVVKSGRLNTPILNHENKETAQVPVSQRPIEIAAINLEPIISIAGVNSNNNSNTYASNDGSGNLISIPDLNLDPRNANREIFQFALIDKPIFENQSASPLNIHTGLGNKIYDLPIPRASEILVEEIDNSLSEMSVASPLKVVNNLTKVLMGGWKFGMYTHADYNQIYLPDQYLLVYGIKSPLYTATTVKSYGYGAGFKAHYINKRVGGEIGLGYAKRSYALPNNRSYYLDPYWNIRFKKIEYDIIEMPISIKYTSKNNTRLKSYAMVGVNANFITKAIYDILPEIKQITTNNIDSRGLTADQNIIKNRVEDQFTILDKRRALLYGQGTLGLEWKINTKMDIYSQLTYAQRVLTKQFGPNWDQFKSLSLEIGLKTAIN